VLIGGLWGQLAQKLAGETNIQICRYCNSPFVMGPGPAGILTPRSAATSTKSDILVQRGPKERTANSYWLLQLIAVQARQ
jgi:hypothetical protein